MNANRLGGLIAATYTPMDETGELSLAPIRSYCKALIDEGAVSGVFVCGTTGEGLSLTVSERKHVAEEWMDAAGGRLKVIVHVGHTSVTDAGELAAHAASVGVDGVAAMGPVFFKPAGLSELVRYCGDIAAEAPETPFYYYHIPAMTGLDFPMRELLPEASRAIPNFAGIKFTHGDLMDYQRCLQWSGGRHELLFGRDEMLLPALALGATGAVGSTYSYAASLYSELIQAFHKGDLETARARQARAQDMISILLQHGVIPAGKALLPLLGFSFGPPRPPLFPLSEAEAQALRASLMKDGFLDVCLNKQPA